MPIVTIGCSSRIVLGSHALRPLIGLPADALRVRLRLRQGEVAFADVKFPDRIERWLLEEVGEGDVISWKLWRILAANITARRSS